MPLYKLTVNTSCQSWVSWSLHLSASEFLSLRYILLHQFALIWYFHTTIIKIFELLLLDFTLLFLPCFVWVHRNMFLSKEVTQESWDFLVDLSQWLITNRRRSVSGHRYPDAPPQRGGEGEGWWEEGGGASAPGGADAPCPHHLDILPFHHVMLRSVMSRYITLRPHLMLPYVTRRDGRMSRWWGHRALAPPGAYAPPPTGTP